MPLASDSARQPRPKKGRINRVFCMDRVASKKIDELAQEYELSYSDVVNLLIRQALEGKKMPWGQTNGS